MQKQDMLTGGEFLFPSLDLFLPRERVGLHNAVDDGGDFRVEGIDIGIAFETLDSSVRIVAVCLGFGGDGKLGDLGRGLILDDLLAGSANVQNKRMVSGDAMELGMRLDASTASVEAL